VGSWKHDRDYYFSLAKRCNTLAIVVFVLFLAMLVISLMEDFRWPYWGIDAGLILLYIWLLRKKSRALYNFHRAPAKL